MVPIAIYLARGSWSISTIDQIEECTTPSVISTISVIITDRAKFVTVSVIKIAYEPLSVILFNQL